MPAAAGWWRIWPSGSTPPTGRRPVVDRIALHGPSGSGKTTLARALSDRLGLPRTELDGLIHQPGWTRLPIEEFRAAVGRAVAGERWVVDGNYREVRDLVWDRAQLVVVFDLPRRAVMLRLFLRTLRRGITRTELWNGNRESLANMVSTDDERNVVLWSWRTLDHYRDEFQAEVRAGAPHARMVVLRCRADVDALIEELAPGD
jgi:adenylate kinase family enzyme